MSSPALPLPATADGERPRRAALNLLACLPADQWATTGQIAQAALRAGLDLSVAAAGTTVLVDGKNIDWLLRGLRRHGWVIYNRHVTPPAWKRTPNGDEAVSAAAVTKPGART